MAGVNLSRVLGPTATQIDRGILKSALVRARKSGQPGMSLGLKTSIRNMVSNSRVKPGQHPSYVNPTIGDVNAGLDQFAKFGNVAPRRGAEGPRPSQRGQQMIDGITEHATDFKFGDGDAFLPTRLPEGTVSRSAPATRNMTSAQKGAMIARKGKKKGKKKDDSWPVATWGSLPSDGYKRKKGGSKGGMR